MVPKFHLPLHHCIVFNNKKTSIQLNLIDIFFSFIKYLDRLLMMIYHFNFLSPWPFQMVFDMLVLGPNKDADVEWSLLLLFASFSILDWLICLTEEVKLFSLFVGCLKEVEVVEGRRKDHRRWNCCGIGVSLF